MGKENIQYFEDQPIRAAWDEEKEEWYFSVVDIVQVLTESADGRKYWNKLKQRLREEGSELVTNCQQLKLKASDGKKRLTDVANIEQLLRIIQSIPSKKAEPFKMWLAEVGRDIITGKEVRAAWMHRNVAYARVIAGLTGEKKLNPAYLVEVMDLTLMASVAKAAL